VEKLVSDLDEALYLDNARFAAAYQKALNEYRSAPSRAPALIEKGYPSNKSELAA
jgi:hypothetical protein